MVGVDAHTTAPQLRRYLNECSVGYRKNGSNDERWRHVHDGLRYKLPSECSKELGVVFPGMGVERGDVQESAGHAACNCRPLQEAARGVTQRYCEAYLLRGRVLLVGSDPAAN